MSVDFTVTEYLAICPRESILAAWRARLEPQTRRIVSATMTWAEVDSRHSVSSKDSVTQTSEPTPIKEGTMPKLKFLSRVLAVIAVFLLFATAAHAGGGQGGGSDQIIPFQCYLINDGDAPPSPNDVLNLVDQFGTRENVKVGKARLLCTPVIATKPGGGVFDPAPAGSEPHLTCYTISPFSRESSGRVRLYNPDAVVDLSDELNSDTAVKVSVPAFLCTLSDKTCVSGANCPPPTPAE